MYFSLLRQKHGGEIVDLYNVRDARTNAIIFFAFSVIRLQFFAATISRVATAELPIAAILLQAKTAGISAAATPVAQKFT